MRNNWCYGWNQKPISMVQDVVATPCNRFNAEKYRMGILKTTSKVFTCLGKSIIYDKPLEKEYMNEGVTKEEGSPALGQWLCSHYFNLAFNLLNLTIKL